MRQLRWVKILKDYNCMLNYHLGKEILDKIIMLHGMPVSIELDRDPTLCLDFGKSCKRSLGLN